MGTPQFFTIDSDTKLLPKAVRDSGMAHGTDDITVIKDASDVRPGVYEFVHNSPTGYLLHLLTGSSAQTASALIGLGVDNSGQGIFINNKKTGVGIAIQQNNSITSGTAYGIYGNQSSTVAPLIHIDQANSTAHVLRIVSSENAVETNPTIEIIPASNSGGGGYISAKSGNIYWRSDVVAVANGRLRAKQQIAGDGNNSVVSPDSVRLSTWNGAVGGYWQKRITQNGQSLLIQGADGTSGGADAAATWLTSFEAKQVSGLASGTQIGFYGVAPVARQASPAAATDAATTQTAVNAIRTALVALGLLS